MILPVVAIGHPNLRKISTEITSEYPGLKQLLADMWETMYFSSGVGLAAAQINKQIRIFVIDATPYEKETPETGILARIIQHEYDHLEGVLFVDKIHPLRKIMIKRKLQEISKGITEAKYKMIFPHKKR